MQLPYAHLNLKHNPFGELTEAERVSLAVVCVDEAIDLLSKPRQVVQYIGGKGHGKTTHLLKIREAFPGCSYVHIPEGQRRPVPTGEPVLIDEAQRLTFWQRRSLFGQHRPLVLGTHRNFQKELQRAGRIVTTIAACDRTSLTRLRQIVNDRIQYARRGPGKVPSVSDRVLKKLLQAQDADIRGMLQVLYNLFQQMETPQELKIV